MDQGLPDLVQNMLFATTATEDGKAKKRDAVGEAGPLEITLSRSGYALIKTEEKVLFRQPQFF